MKIKLVGRKKEQEILRNALTSRESEMVSVIGRRRIGKTFLIKTLYKEHLVFELTGTQNAPKREQLQNFAYALQLASGSPIMVKAPENWMEAFYMLITYLKGLPKTKTKKVIFLDELPWMATHKSGFIRALGFFWNSWAVKNDIVLVICGSAASWMIQKIVRDRGGLHNRITRRIQLLPFTLAETEEYLQSRNVNMNRFHLLQLYMAMGGIPHYLKEVKAGKSATQNLDHICFSKTGLLRDEFSNLYTALFDNSDKHIAIVRALASSRQGMERERLIKVAKLPNGGSTTRALVELEQSGFIDVYYPFGKKNKDKLYRLTDEYSLFYLRFIEKKNKERADIWQHLSQTQAYKIWCGYAFESICIKHLSQIKKALSIAGIYSESSSFLKKGTTEEQGLQIDLLLDRNDKTINVFEIKHYKEEFVVSKAYAESLRTKVYRFKEISKTKKLILLTFITVYGLKHNQYSLGLIDDVLTVDALFLD